MSGIQNEGLVSFGGLASGLETDKIIGAMVESAKAPIRQIEREQEKLDLSRAQFQQARTLANDLESAAHRIGTVTRFVPYDASSSSTDIIMASAGTGAQPGKVELDVKQLAQGYLGASQGVSSKHATDLLTSGKVRWREGPTVNEIEVNDATTLESLSLQINDKPGSLTSSVLFDGKSYSLRLASSETGADSQVIFDEDSTGLGLTRPESVIRQGRDAILTLDKSIEVTRPKNTINDVLGGVTLQLKKAGGPVEIDVQPDLSKMGELVQDFVKSYNDLIKGIGELDGEDGEVAHAIGADSILRGVVRGMQDIISRPVAGLTGTYRSLDSIGLSTGKDGLISVNELKLDRALSSGHRDVAQLFARDYAHDTHGVAEKIESHLQRYVAGSQGLFAHKDRSIDGRKNTLSRRQGQMEHHVERYEASLKGRFTDLEQKVSRLKSQNSFLSAQIEANQNSKK